MSEPVSLQSALDAVFPGATPTSRWVRRTRQQLTGHGFDPVAALAVIGLCRDERCAPLRRRLERSWGESFDASSLGGVPLLGRSGIQAAASHAVGRDPAQLVVFGFTHIGVDASGRWGPAPGGTTACGALASLLPRLPAESNLEAADLEFSLLHHALRQGGVRARNLPELTLGAHAVARANWTQLVHHVKGQVDVALFTGVLLHGPQGDWVWSPPGLQIRSGAATAL
jgi:hypothetical protein